MIDESDIAQTVQFLFSASQQIYLAQVTEHIFVISYPGYRKIRASVGKRVG